MVTRYSGKGTTGCDGWQGLPGIRSRNRAQERPPPSRGRPCPRQGPVRACGIIRGAQGYGGRGPRICRSGVSRDRDPSGPVALSAARWDMAVAAHEFAGAA
ncbi:hypothetical protein GCM10027084_03790 [Pseudoxanthomonas sangjuensis]